LGWCACTALPVHVGKGHSCSATSRASIGCSRSSFSAAKLCRGGTGRQEAEGHHHERGQAGRQRQGCAGGECFGEEVQAFARGVLLSHKWFGTVDARRRAHVQAMHLCLCLHVRRNASHPRIVCFDPVILVVHRHLRPRMSRNLSWIRSSRRSSRGEQRSTAVARWRRSVPGSATCPAKSS
jgi:hypothetical protein